MYKFLIPLLTLIYLVAFPPLYITPLSAETEINEVIEKTFIKNFRKNRQTEKTEQTVQTTQSESQPQQTPPVQPFNFFVPTKSVTKPLTQEQQPVPAEPQAQPVQPLAKQPVQGTGKVSLNFDDADVYTVIQTIFGDILKKSYIIDPRVKGRVNFRSAAPVAKKDILPLMEVILRLNGIGIVEAEGLYRIVPIGDLPKEPAPVGIGREVKKIGGKALVQIVPVKYLESSELIRVLTPFLSKEAVIVDVPKSNHIVIVDTDANVKRLLKLVELFDNEQIEQVKPQVFVYPVQNSKAEDVANILNQIFLGGKTSKSGKRTLRQPDKPISRKTNIPKRPSISRAPSGTESLVSEVTRIFPDEITNSIIILATPDDYSIIEKVIKKLDIVPRQVMIEALIAEVTLSDKLAFGIEWFLKSDLTIGSPLTGFTGFGSQSLSFDPASPLGATGFSFAAVDAANVIRGLLQTLATESKVKVIASPHIMTSDNREAKIQVGKQVPVQTSTSVTAGGETVTSIQYRDTGVVLTVKPQINESGLVSLEIKQEVSSVDPEAGVGGNPVISNRTAQTNIVVQNGQTIVIGGLIQENKSKVREGIPLLKDIPLLGYLFGYTTDSKDRTELIILITPRVIKSVDEAKIMTDEFSGRLEGTDGDILEPFKTQKPPEEEKTVEDNTDEDTIETDN